MNEAAGSLVLALWLVCAVNADAGEIKNNYNIEEEAPNDAQPTIVWGAARNVSGGENEDLVEQSPEAGNPLGDPIADSDTETLPSAFVTPQPNSSSGAGARPELRQPAPIVQESNQGVWKPGEVPLPQPSDKIENELYQSGNDIIDVQAYPIKDVSTVTEPNLQPTIISQ